MITGEKVNAICIEAPGGGCEYPKLEPMVKLKGHNEISYRCLVCGTVITPIE